MRFGYDYATLRAAEQRALANCAPDALLKQAARKVAAVAIADLKADGFFVPGSVIAGLIGGGNNGADGLYALAYLARRGAVAQALVLHPRPPAGALAAAQAAGVRIHFFGAEDDSARPLTETETARLLSLARSAGIWIDALTGIGLTGQLRPRLQQVIKLLREEAESSPKPPTVIAVDIPSGIPVVSETETTWGALPAEIIPADVTVAMGGASSPLWLPPASLQCGTVEELDLGFDLLGQPARTIVVGREDLPDLLPPADAWSHKYNRGVVTILAGSENYPGAALLAASGAHGQTAFSADLRAAALTAVHPGMVRYVGPPALQQLVVASYPRTVVSADLSAALLKSDAVVCGPGWVGEGRYSQLREILKFAQTEGVAVVLDASALDLFARLYQDSPATMAAAPTMITPHLGELRRIGDALGLVGEPNPVKLGARIAQLAGVVVLVKGHQSVALTPAGQAYTAPPGSPLLARAGSGDILSGILGAILAIRGSCGIAAADESLALSAMAATILHSESVNVGN
ncbi:bifunctional ADP-dependent NAD(P)H-hydrate dehydratase/NAD(P)H-hydrate epimerase [Boudabousia marimammalium]|uniref:ADP-dependent (S)-NAD(P)H-hydrate dehydratase n=1 Tax=Boudabousia marimammalium TaxID=156892 RepID=A0A1Q5PJI5_9ACTO|nr:bifunctional ADP-dependent NAD(P)H-hydrate dehydratase/NAD(P)H-hydrate epimerase [Boudabousia marimammalium]OKL46053.1 hypothetical protein BM477_07705 [Boudabousia marimammalium]